VGADSGGLDTSYGFAWASAPGAWRDYTRVLRLVQYGEAEAPLYFALNRFATTTSARATWCGTCRRRSRRRTCPAPSSATYR